MSEERFTPPAGGDLRSAIAEAIEADSAGAADMAGGAEDAPTGRDSGAAAGEAGEGRADDEGAAARRRSGAGGAAAKGSPSPGDDRSRPAGAEGSTEAAPAGAEGEGAAAPADPRAAPAHWSAADKAQFHALPEAARAPFLDLYKRMEGGFTPKLQRGAQLEKDYGALDQIFTPENRRSMAANGSRTPVDLIHSWAEVENTLSNPQGRDFVIAKIIQAYRANPTAIAGHLQTFRAGNGNGYGANGGATPVDPALAARLERLEGSTAARAAADQAVAVGQAQRMIDNFANAKGPQGELLHQHFAAVEPEMMRLVTADRMQGKTGVDLEDLYTRAAWGNPEIRAQMLAAEHETRAKQNVAERRAKTEQARRAGASVTGAPGPGHGANGAAEGKSLHDTIKAAMSSGQTSGGGRI